MIKPLENVKDKKQKGELPAYGLGKMTLKELAEKRVVDIGKVRAYLSGKGVNASVRTTLKEIAEKA